MFYLNWNNLLKCFNKETEKYKSGDEDGIHNSVNKKNIVDQKG